MLPIFLIVGPPAVGKSCASRSLAACFTRSLHIPVDDLRMMVVSGLQLPSAVWNEDLAQQVSLARGGAVHLALNYQSSGFAVIIDDFWDAAYTTDYRELLKHPALHRVILLPEQAEAHRRNLHRSGDNPVRAYIDEGIQIVYNQLNPVLPQLAQQGWVVVDSTKLSIEETVTTILQQTATQM